MSRPSVLLLSVASVALLAAGVILWRSIRSEAVPLPPPQRSTDVTTAAPPTPAPASPSTPAARPSPRTTPSALPTRTAAPPPRVEAASPLAPEDFPNPYDETDLQFGADQLFAQTAAVEPNVRDCVSRSGQHATGTAMLTYKLAKHGDKVSVDETGINEAQTTLKDEALLTCLHQTASAMKFAGLPRNAKVLYVSRSVTLEDGKLVEYKHASFSYYLPR